MEWHVVPPEPKDIFDESFFEDTEKAQMCKLNSWYQMLSILYMLLIYCQSVVFLIVFCSVANYMKRFFLIVDDIPFDQQRTLPVSQGGRGHPLMRRSFYEYRCAFDYAYFVMSRGRINRQAEIRYLQTYKDKLKEAKLKRSLKTVTYIQPKLEVNLIQEPIDEMRQNLIEPADDQSIKTETSDIERSRSGSFK